MFEDEPTIHKCEPDRQGKPMTKQEMHEFGLGLLIVYLHKQNGKLLRASHLFIALTPNLILENPKGELLWVWVETSFDKEMRYDDDSITRETRIILAKKYKAIPVFAGILLKYDSTEENAVPLCGEGYYSRFTGFKAI